MQFARMIFVAMITLIGVQCGERNNSRTPADPPRESAPRTLAGALAVRHEGRTLREVLGVRWHRRYAIDAVIAFRTRLGRRGPYWLARAIEEGHAGDTTRAFWLFDTDLEAAAQGRALIRKWMDAPSEPGLSVSSARLLIEAGDDSPHVAQVIMDGLHHQDSSIAVHAASQISLLHAQVDVLSEPLMAHVESCRRNHGPIEIASLSAGVVAESDREDFCGLILRSLAHGSDRVDLLVPRLLALLRSARSDKPSVLVVLASRGPRSSAALPLILELCNSDDADTRAEAALALGKIGVNSNAVADALRVLSADDVGQVRRAAENAQTQLAGFPDTQNGRGG